SCSAGSMDSCHRIFTATHSDTYRHVLLRQPIGRILVRLGPVHAVGDRHQGARVGRVVGVRFALLVGLVPRPSAPDLTQGHHMVTAQVVFAGPGLLAVVGEPLVGRDVAFAAGGPGL